MFDELRRYIEQEQAAWQVPGLALAVVRGDEVLLAEGFGLRDVAGGLPVTPDTLFAIGSSTKAFTATALGLLVDQGRLDWDRPLREYLPFFRMHDPLAGERITPRDLLCHRSGLPRHDLVWYGSDASRRELVERIRHLEPSKDFRSVWQYQNLMFAAAGLLAGELAGSSWEELVRQQIFEPLGMRSANFSVLASQQAPDHALPYRLDSDGRVVQVPFRRLDAVGPAGSINASLRELSAWVRLQLSGGKVGERQLVSPATLAQIHTPHMVVPEAPPLIFEEVQPLGYGLGWFVQSYRGRRLVHHGGNIDGFSALVSFLPQQQIGVAVLSNLDGNALPAALSYRVYDLLLEQEPLPWGERYRAVYGELKAAAARSHEQARAERRADTRPSHPLADYAGSYAHPGYGRLEFALAGEELRATINGLELRVEHLHYDIFELALAELDLRQRAAFSGDLQGQIASVAVQFEPSVAPIVFARVAGQAMRARAFLERFAGAYELLGQRVTVALRGEDTLVVGVPGQPDYTLEPARDTTFTIVGLSNYRIEFKQDAGGAVVALVFHQPNGSFEAARAA